MNFLAENQPKRQKLPFCQFFRLAQRLTKGGRCNHATTKSRVSQSRVSRHKQ